jgi:hypothetical protein
MADFRFGMLKERTQFVNCTGASSRSEGIHRQNYDLELLIFQETKEKVTRIRAFRPDDRF